MQVLAPVVEVLVSSHGNLDVSKAPHAHGQNVMLLSAEYKLMYIYVCEPVAV